MKKANKLVALLLAAVMVLGLMPTMTVQAHAHDHEAALQGIEEYPVIALDKATPVEITEGGAKAYFTFTPEVTDLYHFYSFNPEGGYGPDTYAHLYDADMTELAYNDDAGYPYAIEGISGPNFCLSHVLEAGVTYVYAARLYSAYSTGSFQVTLTRGHEYESAVAKEPTCAEDGILRYTCKHCGDSYDEPIPARHEYGEDGNCIHCGEVYLVSGTCGEGLTWTIDWFGNLVISGTGAMDDYSVSYSASNPAPWYTDHADAITSVVIEDGVTSVGSYAFYQCRNLVKVTLADSVTTLGRNAFNNCGLLTSISLPDGITAIPDFCFNYCKLTEIDWPANLTSIGDNAFAGCDFGDLTLPEGVTTIGDNAFSSCSNITRLTLPSTLTTLDDYAFYGMWNTKEFVFTGDAPTIGSACFQYTTTTVWYPAGNDTWTDVVGQNFGGTLTWKPLCAENHPWGDPVNIEATCEVGSYTTVTCTACGFINYSPKNDDALGHDYQYAHYDGGCGESSYDTVTCSRCDYESIENRVWNDHAYETTQVAATCTEGGYSVDTCSICGDSYQWNWTAPLGHSVESWGEATEATCTEPSVRTGACARCGETATEEVAPALGHEWDQENGVENEDGSVTYSCIRCDATYRTEGSYLYLGDNTFTIAAESGGSTKTFTAESDGTLTITLNNLYYHNAWAWDMGWIDEYWSTLAIDYAFNNGFFNVFVNDVNTAYTIEGSETAANVILNTIEVKAGDVVTLDINHLSSSDYHNNDVQLNVNLALEGTEPEPSSDTLVLGDNEIELSNYAESDVLTWTAAEDGILTVEMTKLSMYLYTFWNEEPVAPHLEDGNIHFLVNGELIPTPGTTVAVKAGDVVTVQILNKLNFVMKAIVTLSFEKAAEAPLALTLGDNTIDLPNSSTGEGPLCTWTADADGVLTVTLASIVYHDELRYPIFGQYWMDVPVQSALQYGYFTFEVNGTATDYDGIATVEVKTGDVVTVKVGNAYSHLAQAVVNLSVEQAHEHSYEAVVTAPTCTEGGYTTYTCECGDSYVADETAALGHTEGEAVHENEVAATCTEDGSYEAVVYCTVCGVELSRETVEVAKLGHDYQVKEIVPPTCTKSGYTVYECSRCGKTYKDDPVEPEHKWDEGTVTAPTCTELGYTTYTCLICGLEYVDEASWVPALGHEWKGTGCTRCDATRENPFTDVPEHEFYIDPVLWAVEKGITKGATDTTFNPNGACMRGHVVTFLWRAMGSPEPKSTDNPFVDVPEREYYYKAVLWAYENGITTGIDATHFGPTVECNRAQVVTFLWRAMGKPDSNAEVTFTDMVPGQFYNTAVAWAVEHQITNGMGDGTFGVLKTCNRAQVVTFLYRALNK